MKHALIRLALYACIALVPACGSRKVQTDIYKTEQKDVTKEESKGNVTKESGSEAKEGNTTQNDIVKEQQDSRVTELFNENGTLKSRITELLNSRSTDRSVITQYKTFRAYVFTDSNFYTTIYRDRTITIKTKHKKTDTNNKPLYWMLFGIGAISVVVWGIVRYLKG